ncbi:hypothetical protein SLE2022_108880 [Rubroshorea leprosula]
MLPRSLLLLLTTLLHLFTSTSALGVNYGTIADNLPSPTQVANFIKTQTIFDSVKIFDTNPDILRAFANTGISMTVTVGNGDIPALANTRNARRWVANNIKPFYPQTNIKYICVGNEILFSNNQDLINNLVPALRSLHNALAKAGFGNIKVTTAHALNIFQGIAVIPSLARFRADYARSFFLPLLQFHRRTKSPFMINPYPYFTISPKTLNFAIYKLRRGVIDRHSGKLYTNMLDQLLDSTYSAMNAVGYGDVDIVIGETGWPSLGDPSNVANIDNAMSYNGNLIRELLAGKGTPLMPNRRFEAYIFALFNENQKPGPVAERNWGLFWPNFAPVYNSGVLRNGAQTVPTPAVPAPATGKQFCVPKQGISDGQLQSNIDYICAQGVDCSPINPGGGCTYPNNIRDRATFAMNSYYRTRGQTFNECNFGGTGQLTTVDPSHGSCQFL